MQTGGHSSPIKRGMDWLHFAAHCAVWLVAGYVIAAHGGATEPAGQRPEAADTVSAEPAAAPWIDATADPTRIAVPEWPSNDGTCYLYPRYTVIAWGSPDPEPVAIVRKRDADIATALPNCSHDSLPGDFVVRNEWAEYFCGLWGDLLFIDSGTSDIRSLILYDIPSRSQVLMIDGAGEFDGWVDSVTVRIWVLAGTDLPRSLCPDIPVVLGVGVDSLFALNLEDLSLTALGPWRCHPLQ